MIARLGLPLVAAALLAGCDTAPVTNASGAYYTKRQSGASVLSGGAGYHGAVLKEGTAAAPVAAAEPAKPSKTVQTVKGKLPLPTGYPLLPGDAELWATLTLEQQRRALLFLQDGSTIRASLRTD
jgi:hypothetical protein